MRTRRMGVRALAAPLMAAVLAGSAGRADDFPAPDCRAVGPALVGFRMGDGLPPALRADRTNLELLLSELRPSGNIPSRLYVFRAREEGVRRFLGRYTLVFTSDVCPDGCTAYAVNAASKPQIIELYYRARVIVQSPRGADATKPGSLPGGLVFMAEDRRQLVFFADTGAGNVNETGVFRLRPGSTLLDPYWSGTYPDCLLNMPGEGKIRHGSASPSRTGDRDS